jgi:hypothetical protein
MGIDGIIASMKRLVRWTFHAVAAMSLLICVLAFCSRVLALIANDRWMYEGDSSINDGKGTLGWSYQLESDGGELVLSHGKSVDPARVYSYLPAQWSHQQSAAAALDGEKLFWAFRPNSYIKSRKGFAFGDFTLLEYQTSALALNRTNYIMAIPSWFVMGAGAVLPAIWEYKHRALFYRRRRGKRGMCVNCGYDLRATPKMCPECGTVVRAS